MENQQDNSLMKARSYRSVLATGFRLYSENFRRLFKASWQMALLYAVVCGCLGVLLAIKIPEMTLAIMQQLAALQGLFVDTLQQYTLTVLEIWGLTLLAVITLALASATILNKLKEHKETGAITIPPHWLTGSPRLMGRTLKGVLLTLLVMLLPLLLFIGLMTLADIMSPNFVLNHIVTTLAAFLVCTLIAAVFFLPLFHVLMKYIMEAPCGYWHTLNDNYGKALRHWGSLFLVFFVSGLLVELTAIVVMMPAYILNFANQAAHKGVLMGDPLGMPSYITTLTFFTCMFCCFVQFYVSQVMLVHNYYIYGSIETQEEEKRREIRDNR